MPCYNDRMATDTEIPTCRLCHAPLRDEESERQLCGVCDEYAQHISLQSNKRFERIVPEVQQGALFVAASKNAH